MITIYKINQE